jgi:hypothetical protein
MASAAPGRCPADGGTSPDGLVATAFVRPATGPNGLALGDCDVTRRALVPGCSFGGRSRCGARRAGGVSPEDWLPNGCRWGRLRRRSKRDWWTRSWRRRAPGSSGGGCCRRGWWCTSCWRCGCSGASTAVTRWPGCSTRTAGSTPRRSAVAPGEHLIVGPARSRLGADTSCTCCSTPSPDRSAPPTPTRPPPSATPHRRDRHRHCRLFPLTSLTWPWAPSCSRSSTRAPSSVTDPRSSPRATKKAGDFPGRKDRPAVVRVARRLQIHFLQRQQRVDH